MLSRSCPVPVHWEALRSRLLRGLRAPGCCRIAGAFSCVCLDYWFIGIHFCLNLTAHAAGAGGVLLRAGEVLAGRDLAVQRRGGKDTGAKLLSGPGRLGQGLGVGLPMDGTALQIREQAAEHETNQHAPNQEVSFVLRPASSSPVVRTGPRVGVSGLGGSHRFPWRFWVDQDRSVSAYRPGKGVPTLEDGALPPDLGGG